MNTALTENSARSGHRILDLDGIGPRGQNSLMQPLGSAEDAVREGEHYCTGTKNRIGIVRKTFLSEPSEPA